MSTSYTEERLKVGELLVDRRVQRESLNTRKIENMKKNFNENALGVVTISRRNDAGLYIIDGWHRVRTVMELTDGTGEVPAHVFEGLTVPQEALMFLALNYSDQPTALDKFRVRVEAEDPDAMAINSIVGSYEWKITPNVGVGNIQAIQALERLYVRSIGMEAEPNLLQLYILVVTKAWGHDRDGVTASLIEGIGRFLAEYRDKIEIDSLINKLGHFRGGPSTLHSEASQFAKLSHSKVSMAVANIVTETYNKGRRSTQLPPWRHRS